MRAHAGNKGNEKADELAKKGAKIRADLMLKEGGEGWFKRTVEKYWGNRRLFLLLLSLSILISGVICMYINRVCPHVLRELYVCTWERCSKFVGENSNLG